MIEPGETLLKQDPRNHLWIVLSRANERGEIALVNLTTHRPERADHRSCLIVRRGEHPWVRHDSCVRFREAQLQPAGDIVEQKAKGQLPQHEVCTPDLLQRLQTGVAAERQVPRKVRDAIRATLEGGI